MESGNRGWSHNCMVTCEVMNDIGGHEGIAEHETPGIMRGHEKE